MSDNNQAIIEKQNKFKGASKSNKLLEKNTLKDALEESIIVYFLNHPIVDPIIEDINPIWFSGNISSIGKISLNREIINALKQCYLENKTSSIQDISLACKSDVTIYMLLKEFSKKPTDESTNIAAYIDRLRKFSISQEIQEIVTSMDQSDLSSSQLSEKLIEAVNKIDDGIEKRLNNSFLPKLYTLDNLYEDLDKTINGLKTGYTELDKFATIEAETITLIAGRPSHGKSAFMLNIFLNQLNKYPHLRFYYISYEETAKQIAIKIILNLSSHVFPNENQNFTQMQGYIKSKSNREKLIETAKLAFDKWTKEGRLQIIDRHYPVDELCKVIKCLKSDNTGCFYVDYIQLIPNKDRFHTRQLELANTSRQILRCVQNVSTPIILGCQLGRDTQRSNKLRLDNLRECGDLEQDANTIIGIYNDAMNQLAMGGEPVTNRVISLEVIPIKNRVGPANIPVNLQFDRPILKIKD